MKLTIYRTIGNMRMKESSSEKRLLILCPLYSPQTGGLQNHAEQFNMHMAQRGFIIRVFTPQLSPQAPLRESPEKNIDVIRFPAWEIIPNYPLPKLWQPLFWKQLQLALHEPFDCILSRTRFFITSPMAFIIAKAKQVLWLHVEHGSDYVQLLNPLTSLFARAYDEILGRFIFLTADMLVANSQASAAFVKKLAPKRVVHVIYRGVEVQKIAAIKAKTLPYPLIVSFAGRLIDGKGVADLLKAFSKINQPGVHLQVIGDGPQRRNLEHLAEKLHITQQITFYGDTPWDEVIAYLKASDIVVNPSYTEGLPTSVIEAALCDCAIIATDVGGTREIISDKKSGLLISPRDTTQLATALQRLVQDEDVRLQLAINAKHDVAQRFSWNESLAQYEQLLLR